MPGFLSPAWLAALAVLAIPLGLHLWSRRPRHLVRLGSLRHLAGSPGPRAWGRKLEDLPLLLLRLAILAAVVLGLAGLALRPGSREASTGPTVILADRALVADSLTFYSDPLVDSLRRAQSPIRVLIDGFPLLESAGAGQDGGPASHWSLLRSLDDSLPPGSQILVIASATAGELGGARPRLRAGIQWHQPTRPGSGGTVAATWPMGDDSLGILTEMREGWVVRRSVDIESKANMAARSGVGEWEPSAKAVPLLTNRSVAVSNLQVVIDKEDSQESLAVSAAFQAAMLTASGHPPATEVVGPGEAGRAANSSRTIIWLSRQSVPDSLLDAVQLGATLVEFPVADTATAITTAALPVGSSAAIRDLVPVTILQQAGPIPGTPLWETSEGAPFLTIEPLGAGRHFRLATRPEPDWSDLTLGSALPELAWQVVTLGDHPADPARVAPSQAEPRTGGDGSRDGERRRPLGSVMVLVAAALLLAERAMVHLRREAVL